MLCLPMTCVCNWIRLNIYAHSRGITTAGIVYHASIVQDICELMEPDMPCRLGAHSLG